MLFRCYCHSKSLQGKLHFPCVGYANYPFVDLPPMNDCRAIIHRQQVFLLSNSHYPAKKGGLAYALSAF